MNPLRERTESIPQEELEFGLEVPPKSFERLKEAFCLEVLYHSADELQKRKIEKRYERLSMDDIFEYLHVCIYDIWMQKARGGEAVTLLEKNYQKGIDKEVPALSLALNVMHTTGRVAVDYAGFLTDEQLDYLSNIPQEEIDKYKAKVGITASTEKWKPRLTAEEAGKHWMQMAYGEEYSSEDLEYYQERLAEISDLWELKKIPLAKIETHHSGHDQSKEYIDDYIKMKQSGGTEFPPVILESIGGGKYRTLDGQHRVKAAKKMNLDAIDAYVPVNQVAADVEAEGFLPPWLVMVDCEMTGVIPKRDKLLQVAMLKLKLEDNQYVEQGDPLVLYLKHDGQPTNNFHRQYLSHIFERCNESDLTPGMAKEKICDWLGELLGKAPPCGDCVPTDIHFLKEHGLIDEPDVGDEGQIPGTFHYEFFDMNSIKAVARHKAGEKFAVAGIDEEHVHDALVDCRNQTKELNAIIAKLLGTEVQAGISSVLYHATNLKSLRDILAEDRFKLSTSIGTLSDDISRPEGNFYFFSTSRSKVGDYARRGASVQLVLDGNKLKHKYPGSPVDYWGPGFRKASPEKHEMEDRIWSREPYITHAADYIKEIHIWVAKQDERDFDDWKDWIKQVLQIAGSENIPVYLYPGKDVAAFQLLNKKKALDPAALDLNVTNPLGEFQRSLKGYDDFYGIKELYDKQVNEKLSKEADEVLYRSQPAFKEEYLRGLKAKIHNYKDRPESGIADIVKIMQKEKLKDIPSLIDFLWKKWSLVESSLVEAKSLAPEEAFELFHKQDSPDKPINRFEEFAWHHDPRFPIEQCSTNGGEPMSEPMWSEGNPRPNQPWDAERMARLNATPQSQWTAEDKKFDQDWADEDRARGYAKLSTKPPPVWIIWDGKQKRYRFWNGRHRTRAAWLKGDRTIDAYVGYPVSEKVNVSASFHNSFNIRGRSFDVFKNPTRKEMKELEAQDGHQEVRAFLVGNDLYAWPTVAGLHAELSSLLNLSNDAISLNMGIYPGDGKSYWATVTDWVEGKKWDHSPEIKDAVLSNKAFSLIRDRNEFELHYYDEAIVGDWTMSEEEKEMNASVKIELSAADAEKFLEIIQNPPEPSPALVRAMKRYRRIKSAEEITPEELPVAVQPVMSDDGALPEEKKQIVISFNKKALRCDSFQDFQELLNQVMLEAELTEEFRPSVAGILNEHRVAEGYVAL